MSTNYKTSYHERDHYVMTFESFDSGVVKSKVSQQKKENSHGIFCFQPPTVKEMFARSLMQIAGMSIDNILALTEIYPTPVK